MCWFVTASVSDFANKKARRLAGWKATAGAKTPLVDQGFDQ
jgi:hypothetical protein